MATPLSIIVTVKMAVSAMSACIVKFCENQMKMWQAVAAEDSRV